MEQDVHDALDMAIKALEQPEPCEDTISREAVISMIDTYMNKSIELHYLPTSDGIKKLISILPSAQPERKTGHWVKSDMQRWYDVWLCSECGEKTDSAVMSKPRYKYCPMCGAKMERGEKDE